MDCPPNSMLVAPPEARNAGRFRWHCKRQAGRRGATHASSHSHSSQIVGPHLLGIPRTVCAAPGGSETTTSGLREDARRCSSLAQTVIPYVTPAPALCLISLMHEPPKPEGEEQYFGLTPGQLNAAFLGLIGLIAAGVCAGSSCSAASILLPARRKQTR